MQQHDVQNYGIQHNGIHNHKQNQCTQPYKKKHNGTHQYGTQQHCIQWFTTYPLGTWLPNFAISRWTLWWFNLYKPR